MSNSRGFFVLLCDKRVVATSQERRPLQARMKRYPGSQILWWDGDRYWQSPGNVDSEPRAGRDRRPVSHARPAASRPRPPAKPPANAAGTLSGRQGGPHPSRASEPSPQQHPGVSITGRYSGTLSSVLSGAPQDLVRRWTNDGGSPPLDSAVLRKQVEDLWVMHELWRFTRGSLDKCHVEQSDPLAVLGLLTPEAIDRFAHSRHTSTGTVHALLRRLADLPIPLETRGYVRSAMQSVDQPIVAETPSVGVQGQGSSARPRPSPTTSPEPIRHEIDFDALRNAWIARLLSGQTEELRSASTSMLDALATLVHRPAMETALDALEALRAGTTEFAELARRFALDLPSSAHAAQLLSDGSSAFERSRALFGADLKELFELQPQLAPRDLLSLCEVATSLQPDAAPRWLFPDSPTTAGRLASLIRPEVRERYESFVAVVREFPDFRPEIASEIPEPGSAEVFADAVRAALMQLSRIPAPLRDYLRRERLKGGSPDVLDDCVTMAHELASRVSADALFFVASSAASAGDLGECSRQLRQWRETVNFAGRLLGGVSSLAPEQLKHLAEQRVKLAEPRPPGVSASHQVVDQSLTIDHDWTGRHGARAPLTCRPLGEMGLGVVSIPLKLHTAHPRAIRARVLIDVVTRQRQGWPATWPTPTPELVTVSKEDWIAEQDSRGFFYPFKLELPIRRPAKDTESLECFVWLADEHSERVVSERARFRWEQIGLQASRIIVAWPDGVNPTYVSQHPIGPQRHHAQIEARLQQGAAFAVISPRRFGKSTLVRYLGDIAERNGIVCPPPVVCTQYVVDSRLDYGRLWAAVSERLQALVGSSLGGNLDAPVPEQSAFDYVRRAAKTRGKNGVLLLFDEAQLFFPREGGHTVGDRLKDKLEGGWAQCDPVPVVFGLVGLPRLAERAGTNVMGLMRPIEEYSMAESELGALLLGVTANALHTTRSARLGLARSAGNLFLLRTLLDSLVARLNLEGRVWANLEDVRAVEFELTEQLRMGQATTVGGFVRDALNTADSVNDWQPDVSFPTAVALALAHRRGVADPQERRTAVTNTLTTWCQMSNGEVARLAYTSRQAELFTDRLGDMGVYRDEHFVSSFLEAWLIGQGRNGCPPDARNALVKGALSLIDAPQNAARVGDGAQATLWRFTEGDVSYALRRVEFRSDADRERYLESIGIMRTLIEGLTASDDGAQHIFQLRDVGFSARDEMVGVQIYRWIDGHDLEAKVRSLSAALVAHIGCAIAKALKLLHAKGILHRDICPRNIILSHPDKVPVLIDFGLARLASMGSKTAIASEYAAPEVQGPVAQWSSAADVFGLGITLKRLLRPGAAPPAMLRVLDQCTHLDRVRRPEADALAKSLARQVHRLAVDSQRDAFRATVDSIVKQDTAYRWYVDIVSKFTAAFQLIASGYHEQEFERCAEIADFLNQVLEAFPTKSGARLSLGYVKHPNADTGVELVSRSVEIAHTLRNWQAHANSRKSRSTVLARMDTRPNESLSGHVVAASRLIERHLGLLSLSQLIEYVCLQSGGQSE